LVYGSGMPMVDGKENPKNHYGTPEIINGGYPNKILNVSDAHKMLKEMMQSEIFKKMNDQEFEGMTEMGTLQVFVESNKSMKYTSQSEYNNNKNDK